MCGGGFSGLCIYRYPIFSSADRAARLLPGVLFISRSISIVGFASRPGTAVLPKCSTLITFFGSTLCSISFFSCANISGHAGFGSARIIGNSAPYSDMVRLSRFIIQRSMCCRAEVLRLRNCIPMAWYIIFSFWNPELLTIYHLLLTTYSSTILIVQKSFARLSSSK